MKVESSFKQDGYVLKHNSPIAVGATEEATEAHSKHKGIDLTSMIGLKSSSRRGRGGRGGRGEEREERSEQKTRKTRQRQPNIEDEAAFPSLA